MVINVTSRLSGCRLDHDARPAVSINLHRPVGGGCRYWLTGGFARLDRGYAEKEHLVDRVCALFRQKVIRPVT
jgi:hypothetical protein